VAWRILGGVSIGLASNISPMYIAEIAPPRHRGLLVAVNQLTIVLGVLAAQFVNWRIAEPVPAGLDPATLVGRVQGEVATPPPSEPAQSDAGKAPPQQTADETTRRRHIAIEAYLIAESRGFPPNCEHEHWLEAERRLFGDK
ncbi:MAG: hypothetical protein JWN73_3700, partial [Betaproteobacteria bacterium]|nr:hypothetical protein [Betaproteobacteria bacterium]